MLNALGALRVLRASVVNLFKCQLNQVNIINEPG
jgi:hypothetical protein